MPTEPVGQRDILLHLLEDSFNQIYELCPAYDTLQYTFLVSTGSHGWSQQLELTIRHKVSQSFSAALQLFSFYQQSDNFLILGRRLFQQYSRHVCKDRNRALMSLSQRTRHAQD